MTQSNGRSIASLRAPIHEALALWHTESTESSPLRHLHLWQRVAAAPQLSPHQATNQMLLHALTLLEAQAEQSALLLRRRFLDNELVYKIANELNWAESTFYRKQNEALDQLTIIIQTLEVQAQAQHRLQLLERLELPTYVELIGVEESQARLAALIVAPGPPWLFALEGIGGIGKTSLADALVRQMVMADQLNEFGWVTARQQIFNLGGSIKPIAMPALTTVALVEALLAQLLGQLPCTTLTSTEQAYSLLTSQLKAQPHLIVIDNLETVEDAESLLPLLRKLSNPTKFLLTSRHSLYAEAGLYHFLVPELSEANALRLMRHEARLSNLPQVEQAPDAALLPILAKVGGNPLALRLVVGQMHIHGLDMVLADLTKARGVRTENFYSYIYRRAWDNLDETARNALLAMPMVTEDGGTLAYLAAVSGIDPTELYAALEQLVMLNLVDSRGNLNERYYTIHNLTRTFLHEQVAKWQC